MKQQTLGNKPQRQWKHIKSGEATLTIKKGAPVVLKLDGAISTLGYTVKSIEGLAAAEQGMFFGLAVEDVVAGAESTSVFGFWEYTRMIVRSRAASSDVWASTTGIALGDVLALMTLGGVQAVSRSAAGSALTNPHAIIAAETRASSDTQASSITAGAAGTALIYSTAFVRTHVKIM